MPHTRLPNCQATASTMLEDGTEHSMKDIVLTAYKYYRGSNSLVKRE